MGGGGTEFTESSGDQRKKSRETDPGVGQNIRTVNILEGPAEEY